MKPQFDMYAKAKSIAAEAELEFCRQEGYLHQVKNLEKVKLIEHHAVIDSDDISPEVKRQAACLADLRSAKVQRKLQQLKIMDKFMLAIEESEPAAAIESPVKKLKKHSAHKKVLLEKGQSRLQEMLKTMTRQEALHNLKVTAGVSKRKKKSKQMKPSLKAKPSVAKKKKLTTGGAAKPSLLKKSLKKKGSLLKLKLKSQKKTKIKNVLKKAILSAIEYEEPEAPALEAPALEAPSPEAVAATPVAVTAKSDACAAAPADTDSLKIGKLVLCCSEHAGQMTYGKTGVLKSVANGVASVDFTPGVHQLPLEFLCKASDSKFADFKATKKMQGFNVLTKDIKLKWLQKIDDSHLELPNVEGNWLLDWRINAGTHYIEWALWLQKAPSSRKSSYVDPILSSTWYLCSTDAHPDGLEDVAAAQVGRREMLKQCFDQDFILCPIARATAANHWTLLVIVKDLKEVQYFDSLPVASEGNQNIAEALLQEFAGHLKFPEMKSNAAFQKAGSAVCGTYVLHWMEQACRTYFDEEVQRSKRNCCSTCT